MPIQFILAIVCVVATTTRFPSSKSIKQNDKKIRGWGKPRASIDAVTYGLPVLALKHKILPK
jgi:hypothetical protein